VKRRVNYGKILLVTFITALIWVWADTAQDEQEQINNIPIQAGSTEEDLWLSFDGKTSTTINILEFRGPSSRVNSIKRQWQDKELDLKFFLLPSDVGLSEQGQSSLNLLKFIRNSGLLSDLGVTAVACEPNELKVQVSKLQERLLTVRCMSNNIEVEAKSIEPATVTMLVPADWPAERLVADVELTENEIEQAKLNPIEKTAFVTFSSDLQKDVPEEIMVQLPPAAENLRQYTITGATVGFAFSENLAGKYKPELLNSTKLSSFTIIATPPAKAAYDAQPYKITLHILDEDEQTKTEISREVVYNFPIEFVRDGQIKLNQPKEVARFTLKLNSP